MKSVLLFSGGIDSLATYLLSKNKKHNYRGTIDTLLYFQNSGRNSSSQDKATRNLQHFLSITTDLRTYPMPKEFRSFEKANYELPARNMHFILTATNLGADKIYLGIEKDQDYLYDRSPEFFAKASELLTSLFRRSIQVSAYAPEMSKAELVINSLDGLTGADLSNAITVYNSSFSCYAPTVPYDSRDPAKVGYKECGTCEACVRKFICFDYVNTVLKLKKTLNIDGFSFPPLDSDIFAKYTDPSSDIPDVIKAEVKKYLEIKKPFNKKNSTIVSFKRPEVLKLKLEFLKKTPKAIFRKEIGFFSRTFVNHPNIDSEFTQRTYNKVFCVITAGNILAFDRCITSIKAYCPDALLIVYFNPQAHLSKIENELNLGMVRHVISEGYLGDVKVSKNTIFMHGDDPTCLPFCRNSMLKIALDRTKDQDFIIFLDDDAHITENSGFSEKWRECDYLLGGHSLCFYGSSPYNIEEIKAIQNEESYIEVESPNNGYYQGYCMIANKAVFVKTADKPFTLDFDTDFSFWYEDADFSRKVKHFLKNKVVCFTIPQSWVVHENHGTQKNSPTIFTKQALLADADTFVNKNWKDA